MTNDGADCTGRARERAQVDRAARDIGDEHRVLSIRRPERIEQIHDFVKRDRGRGRRGDADGRAAGGVEDAGGLASAVAGEERGFFRGTDATRKLGRDVGL